MVWQVACSALEEFAVVIVNLVSRKVLLPAKYLGSILRDFIWKVL